ncbi:tape measure protein, partial [Psychrobacter celer]
MAGDLDFSVQLRLLNEQFNNGVNQARDRFGQLAQAIERNVQQMNSDTERAATLIAGLANATPDRLTSSIRATADQIRQMGAGANLSGEQVQEAMRVSAQQVSRLGSELEEARTEAGRLAQTGASPQDIEVATQRVNRLEQELNQARSASVSLANELSGAMNRASSTADSARNAIYRITNVRVPETIRGEIDQINRSLIDFQRNSGRPAEEIDRVTRAAQEQIRRLERELNGLNDTADRTSRSAGGVQNFTKSLVGMAASYVGIMEVVSGLKAVIETAKQLDSLSQKLEYATGSAEAAAIKYKELQETANSLGLEQISLANGYAQLAAATRQIGLSSAETEATFYGVATAAAGMSLTADEANGVFLAMSQIAAKGKVSMEELRQQLGERLTPAMGIAAQSMGMTVAELDKLVSSGNLASKDFLPKFGAALTEAFSEQASENVETMTGKLNIMGNEITDLQSKLAEGFVGDAISGGIERISSAINSISVELDNLDPSSIEAVKEYYSQLADLVGGSFVTVLGMISDLNESFGSTLAILGGADSTAESVGFLTRTVQGLSVMLGIVNDAISGIDIAFSLALGAGNRFTAGLLIALSKLTFGDLKTQLIDLANGLNQTADKAFDDASKKAMAFEGSAKKALDATLVSAKENFAGVSNEATKTYNKVSQDANASAEDVMTAFEAMANEQIKNNGEMALAKLEVLAAEKNLKVAIDETGQATVRAMTASDIAAAEAANKAEKLNAAYVAMAESLGVGITGKHKEARASVLELSESFDVLTDSGYQTGEVLTAALTDMSNKARNTDEILDVIALWEQLGKEGKITGQELADGLELSHTKLDELTDGINSVAEAYGVLGIKTREELAKQAGAFTEAYNIVKEDGKATAQQMKDVFEKTAKANIAANGGVIDSVTARMAAERGVTIAIDEQGRVTFKSMSEAKESNDRVTHSVNNIRTAYDGISSSAGSAGNAMVRAAVEASSAYDKLQAKIKAVKEAQAVADADETMKNLRVYGTEKAPVEGNQFGTRLAVENFLKSQGLSEAAAIEEARKLYAKQGTSGGALNFGKLQGFDDGQMMTPADLNRFKSASVYLAEIAEKARQNERQRDNYEAARTATARITTQEYGRFDSQPSASKT